MAIPRSATVAAAAVVLAALALPSPAQARTVDDAASVGPAAARAGAIADHGPLFWYSTPTGSSDQFRGLSAVSGRVAWVSGETGTVLRTLTRGRTWQDVSPPAAAGLALRDIEAFDADHAVALSIGPGKSSGIFTTNNGGATWTRTFTNRNGNAFYDCMAFSKDGVGLAMSDPVNGRFRLVTSPDRGQTWHLLIPQQMPMAMEGEFAFAASGTCIIPGPGHQFWMATGGVDKPRVFHTDDAGLNWTVAETPVRGGPSAGIYSIAFRTGMDGVAVGGDYLKPYAGAHAAATSYDGGKSWIRSGRPVEGYRSGVDFLNSKLVVAVGPTGSDLSRSGGARWYHFDDTRYDAISCTDAGACWGSGTEGNVARLLHYSAP